MRPLVPADGGWDFFDRELSRNLATREMLLTLALLSRSDEAWLFELLFREKDVALLILFK